MEGKYIIYEFTVASQRSLKTVPLRVYIIFTAGDTVADCRKGGPSPIHSHYIPVWVRVLWVVIINDSFQKTQVVSDCSLSVSLGFVGLYWNILLISDFQKE